MNSPVYALEDYPIIIQACESARSAGRRRYRTRLKEINPPAVAVMIPACNLPLSDRGTMRQGEAILVALPADFAGSLPTLAAATQTLVVVPDVSMLAQEAYVSMSLPAKEPALPLTVWVELRHIVEASRQNEKLVGTPDVAIALVAG